MEATATKIEINESLLNGNLSSAPKSDGAATVGGTQKNGFKLDYSSFTNLSAQIPSIGQALQQARQNIRPWAQFFNINNFKVVANVQRLTSRFLRNLAHFQSNYLIISLVLLFYCLLTSPLILIVMGCCLYLNYKIKQSQSNITIFKRNLNPNQQCICVMVAAAPLYYLAGAGAAMFWVIGASVFVISLHAVFYNIDAIVTEDQEGFLTEV